MDKEYNEKEFYIEHTIKKEDVRSISLQKDGCTNSGKQKYVLFYKGQRIKESVDLNYLQNLIVSEEYSKLYNKKSDLYSEKYKPTIRKQGFARNGKQKYGLFYNKKRVIESVDINYLQNLIDTEEYINLYENKIKFGKNNKKLNQNPTIPQIRKSGTNINGTQRYSIYYKKQLIKSSEDPNYLQTFIDSKEYLIIYENKQSLKKLKELTSSDKNLTFKKDKIIKTNEGRHVYNLYYKDILIKSSFEMKELSSIIKSKKYLDIYEEKKNNDFNFNNMINDYLFDLRISNLSVNTINLRSSLLKSFFKENNSVNDKVSFNKAYKQYVISKQQNDEISEGYIYQLCISLRSFTKYYKLDWCDELKTPKIAKSLPKHLTKEEVQRLFNTIIISEYDTQHTKKVKQMKIAILHLLYSSGLRVSELVKIQLHEIDFNNKTIIVRGKGNKDRVVLFNDETKQQLELYLKLKDTSNYLFPPIRGSKNHIAINFVEKFVKDCGVKANINQKVTPHLLRHSFKTYLISNGANLISMSSKKYLDNYEEKLNTSTISKNEIETITNSSLKEDINSKSTINETKQNTEVKEFDLKNKKSFNKLKIENTAKKSLEKHNTSYIKHNKFNQSNNLDLNLKTYNKLLKVDLLLDNIYYPIVKTLAQTHGINISQKKEDLINEIISFISFNEITEEIFKQINDSQYQCWDLKTTFEPLSVIEIVEIARKYELPISLNRKTLLKTIEESLTLDMLLKEENEKLQIKFKNPTIIEQIYKQIPINEIENIFNKIDDTTLISDEQLTEILNGGD